MKTTLEECIISSGDKLRTWVPAFFKNVDFQKIGKGVTYKSVEVDKYFVEGVSLRLENCDGSNAGETTLEASEED